MTTPLPTPLPGSKIDNVPKEIGYPSESDVLPHDSLPVIGGGVPPSHVAAQEAKLEKCAKISLLFSIFPPVGCCSYAYHRGFKGAKRGSNRLAIAKWSMWLSSLVFLVILLSIFWSTIKWMFWIVLGCCVLLLIAIGFSTVMDKRRSKTSTDARANMNTRTIQS
eukprot:GHVR01023647.1.p1 GENE.GHVR01023647.1~~GHVR01023647.1.p1  ORF type:complete len:164 (-),score=31.83 GHVR01023647.1:253-744(-)